MNIKHYICCVFKGAEVDSKVLTDDFLASIEEDYKDTVLPSLE